MRFRAFAAASGIALLAHGAGCLIYNEELLGGGGSGGMTTGSGTTSTPECNAPEDCPDPGSPCKMRVCTEHVCGIEILPNAELPDPTPGDCHGVICDSGGQPITVDDDKDAFDDKNACTIDKCDFGAKLHEPDVGATCTDSGGKLCNDQGACVKCLTGADCASKVCKDYSCAPIDCSDGMMNGSETDVDCGGMCAGCPTGKACDANTDCASKLCAGNLCQPTCEDGQKNKAETDVDCGGGECPACADDEGCGADSDCASGVCDGSTSACAAPTCIDGKQNGAETGVDCGGMTCPTCPLDHLVINEVDYDQPGNDTAEFVEIYNATAGVVSLSGYRLVLVNGGTNADYGSIDLSGAGTLVAGQYLVVGVAAVTPAAGALKVDLPAATGLQNGPPDGVALFSGTELVDALSYEGAITTANLSALGLGTVSLVEGTALSSSVVDDAGGALCRHPNAKDTDSASTDWKLCAAPTPGGPNAL